MATTNIQKTRIKPAESELLTLRVHKRESVSPHFTRVTLGSGDITKFHSMGYDQWFRLFIPVSENSLSRLPNRLNTLAYIKYLRIAKTERPVLRNYTVRAYRPGGPDGPEFDVDFVVHGSAAEGTAGPAANWAQSCRPGDPVAILDEGVTFNQPAHLDSVLLVADESGLPAVAGILSALPEHSTGRAVIEVPTDEDQQKLDAPSGIEVTWVPRNGKGGLPGAAALEAVRHLPVSARDTYCWAVGEQSLPVGARRHWVAAGVPKANITFCGYWRAGRSHG
ncbi:siderophore-interacting protein [Hoyosella sp. YIM 151337]|uniref:siderophore-interacting protein n=1 Tax=Hoyosella sp. YIM 151337 TaxID=2992742 RepID=UPI002236441D|nr:siderophore-interacting protein [Hoyosella sp. YIM 151337]MCW4352771.1 siderophore-interacting protein [Hoyosella sp. YIM 151337]